MSRFFSTLSVVALLIGSFTPARAADPLEPYGVYRETPGNPDNALVRQCKQELNITSDAIPVGVPLYNLRRCVNNIKQERLNVQKAIRRNTQDSSRASRRASYAEALRRKTNNYLRRSINSQARLQRTYQRNTVTSLTRQKTDFMRARSSERASIQAKEQNIRRSTRENAAMMRAARLFCQNSIAQARITCVQNRLDELKEEQG